MRRGTILVVALVGIATGVILFTGRLGPSSPPPAALPVLGTVPDFALIRQDGQTLTRGSLLGSVWVADFIFTRCAGQCPMMTSRMADLQRALADVPEARFVSVTVDPAYDSPAALAAYAARYGAKPNRWAFLTGERDAILALARSGFRLGVSDEGSEEEPITHSVRFVLVDQAGMIRGTYDATEEDAISRLERDARRLLREAAPTR